MNPDPLDPTRPSSDPLAGMDAKAALAAGLQAQPWEPPLPAELGAVLTDYEILDVIGRGGMGAIYKARDRQLDRCVAIKLLPPELSGRPDLVERFTREARALARLDHPNIVKVYDFSHTAAGHLYFVMEYVDGLDLGRILGARGKTIPQREHRATLEIIGCICDALQYAHNKGIVHRDIKPANVLISKDGQVKVADFGLARAIDPGDGGSGFHGAEAMTVSGIVMGTLEYMAPEQRDGQRVDHRADIYAVGVLFYQMLTGQLPRGAFQAPSRKTGTSDARIDKVVLKALQSEPAARYQRASEVRDAVHALGKLKTPAPPRVPRPPSTPLLSSSRAAAKPCRRYFIKWATTALLLAAATLPAYKITHPGPAAAPPTGASSPLSKRPGTPEPARIPPAEPASRTTLNNLKLPESLVFTKLLPESGVSLSLGSSTVPISPGQSISLTSFGRFDPAKPLTLTASAPGYESTLITLEPADKPARPALLLEPILATFTWKSDPPDWFNAARLIRLDPPEDSRFELNYPVPESGKKMPAGRYALAGMWGKTVLPLGEINLTAKPSGTILKWPLRTSLQWNGIMDLNPQAVLSGPTGPLKQVAASWEILIPVPIFLQFQSNGSATLRITNSQIMQFCVLGLLAGSIGPGEMREASHISKVFRESVIKPLTTEIASGSPLGVWFGNYWQAQSVKNLTRTEDWRASLFERSRTEVAILKGVLTASDSSTYFSNPEYQDALNNFFDTYTLHAESLTGHELKLISQDKAFSLILNMDDRSAKITGSQKNTILKPR